jgi:hypothetical protein
LAGDEVKRASTDHISQWGEGASWFEFDRGANGVSNGKAQQGTASAVDSISLLSGHMCFAKS